MAPAIPILGALAAVGTAYSTIQTIKAKRRAEKEAMKQAGLLKKQEAKIEAERKKQEKATQERRQRLSQRELLTGGETGITGETQATLLRGS